MISGPGSPSMLPMMTTSIRQPVDWIADGIS